MLQLVESQLPSQQMESYCREMGIAYFRLNLELHEVINLITHKIPVFIDLILQSKENARNNPQIINLALKMHSIAENAVKVQKIMSSTA